MSILHNIIMDLNNVMQIEVTFVESNHLLYHFGEGIATQKFG